MNILKWLKSKAGKVSEVGILAGAAGVLAAGLVSYNLITRPTDNSTTFSDMGSRQKIEYTSGSAVDNTQGPELLATSRGVQLVDQQEIQRLRDEQLRENQPIVMPEDSYIEPGSNMAGYQLDGQIGFANANGVSDTGNVDGVVSNVLGLSGLVQSAKDAVAGANGGANGEKGGQPGTGEGGTLQRAEMIKGGSPINGINMPTSGGSSGSGNGVNNEWNPSANLEQSGNALNDAAKMMNSINQEGSGRLNPNANLANQARFANGVRDSRLRKGYGMSDIKGRNDLITARKKAEEIANLRERPANIISSTYLGDSKGPRLEIKDNNQLDKSFQESIPSTNSQKFSAAIGSMGNTLEGLAQNMRDRGQDGNSLKKQLWITFAIVLALSLLIPILKKIPIWGHIAAAIALGLGLVAIAALGVHIGVFSHRWDFNGIAITATAVGAVMTAGLLLSYILPSGTATGKMATLLAKAGVKWAVAGIGTTALGAVGSQVMNTVQTAKGDNVSTSIEELKQGDKKDISASEKGDLANK